MPRPCDCDRIPPPGEPYTTAWCRLCYLYHTSPKHRELWDGQPPEPSFWEKAQNFTRAAVRHAADGFREVSEEEYHRRLAVCQGCEWWMADTNACSKCGCRLAGDKLAKARWASETCPLGKWPPAGTPGTASGPPDPG